MPFLKREDSLSNPSSRPLAEGRTLPSFRSGNGFSSFLLLLVLCVFLFPILSSAQDISNVALENIGLPNWSGQDYSPQISPDGQFLIFQSDRPGSGESANLWFSANKNFRDRLGRMEWTIPIPLRFPMDSAPSDTMRLVRPPGSMADPPGAFSVNTDNFEGMPFLVFHENRPVEIYFTSLRGPERPGRDGLNIYFSRYRDSRWSVPEQINVLNTDFNERMPCLSADGRKIYFVSDRPGGFGNYDIWYSERNMRTGQWAEPVNAGEAWNTAYNEISPGLSPDGKMFFLSSDRPGGFGHFDIYFSSANGTSWEKLENLGEPFNSPRDDETISMTSDRLWAFLASDRRSLDAEGRFDIYRVRVPERLLMRQEVLFSGLVLDGSSRLPLGVDATIRIEYEKGTIVASSTVINRQASINDAANFSVPLLSGRTYRVIFSAPGFHSADLTLNYTGNTPSNKTDRRVVVLQPIASEVTDINGEKSFRVHVVDDETGLDIRGSVLTLIQEAVQRKLEADDRSVFSFSTQARTVFTLKASADLYTAAEERFESQSASREIVIRLKKAGGSGDPCADDNLKCIPNIRIFFALDSAVLSEQELKKIEVVSRILKKHAAARIEIAGHTDHTYTQEYNQRLSDQRARNVRQTLVRLGIAESRLEVHGYGFSRPAVPDTTEQQRRANRRVEFRVISE